MDRIQNRVLPHGKLDDSYSTHQKKQRSPIKQAHMKEILRLRKKATALLPPPPRSNNNNQESKNNPVVAIINTPKTTTLARYRRLVGMFASKNLRSWIKIVVQNVLRIRREADARIIIYRNCYHRLIGLHRVSAIVIQSLARVTSAKKRRNFRRRSILKIQNSIRVSRARRVLCHLRKGDTAARVIQQLFKKIVLQKQLERIEQKQLQDEREKRRQQQRQQQEKLNAASVVISKSLRQYSVYLNNLRRKRLAQEELEAKKQRHNAAALVIQRSFKDYMKKENPDDKTDLALQEYFNRLNSTLVEEAEEEYFYNHEENIVKVEEPVIEHVEQESEILTEAPSTIVDELERENKELIAVLKIQSITRLYFAKTLRQNLQQQQSELMHWKQYFTLLVLPTILITVGEKKAIVTIIKFLKVSTLKCVLYRRYEERIDIKRCVIRIQSTVRRYLATTIVTNVRKQWILSHHSLLKGRRRVPAIKSNITRSLYNPPHNQTSTYEELEMPKLWYFDTSLSKWKAY